MTEDMLFEYEYVRREGRTNMFDINDVGDIAAEHCLFNLADACLSKRDYALVLSQYQEPDEEKFQQWRENNSLPPV